MSIFEKGIILYDWEKGGLQFNNHLIYGMPDGKAVKLSSGTAQP